MVLETTKQLRSVKEKSNALRSLLAQWENVVEPFKNVEWITQDGQGKKLVCKKERG